jgi:cytochrome c biogenesis protein CcmG, thiol:disulfide interchange protein DsbE
VSRLHKSLRSFGIVALFALLCAANSSKNANEIAPNFTRADFAGKAIRLADYRGKLVLLNFWASWCAPCREEMPRFSQWQSDYGAKGLQVIGVSMDDDAQPAKEFLLQHPVSYPIVMGDAKLGEDFGGVLGLPTSYLIDPQGHILARFRGETNLAKLEAEIKTQLSNMSSRR